MWHARCRQALVQTLYVITQTAHAPCLDADLDVSFLLGAISQAVLVAQLTRADTVLEDASLGAGLSMTEQYAAVQLVVLSSLVLSVLTQEQPG